MADLYLWVKAVHVMAVIAWMAGLFYLPRLFVYHCGVAAGTESSELFKVMEQKLFRIIMRPAMIVAWIAGLLLVWLVGALEIWLVVKLVGVVAMSGFHELLGRYVREFAGDGRPGSERYFRIMNEVPTALMVLIVLMVVVKPFA